MELKLKELAQELKLRELAQLIDAGKLDWHLEDDMGGEWIRHDLGFGIDATLHPNEDPSDGVMSRLLLTISHYERGEVIATSKVATIKEAERIIYLFNYGAAHLNKGER